jgi:hypothetical protein
LVEEYCLSPAINANIFPDTPATSSFWSGSPDAGSSRNSWRVNFGDGGADSSNRGNSFRVRLVRGGPMAGKLDLAGAILALKAAGGIATPEASPAEMDVNGDGRIGLEEAIYMLRHRE